MSHAVQTSVAPVFFMAMKRQVALNGQGHWKVSQCAQERDIQELVDSGPASTLHNAHVYTDGCGDLEITSYILYLNCSLSLF